MSKMWKPKSNIDYSVFYGRKIKIYYNRGDNKFMEGILSKISEINSCVSVIFLVNKVNKNHIIPYLYEESHTICGNLIHHIEIEDKDIEFAIDDFCEQVAGIPKDLSQVILEFSGTYIEI